VRGLNYSSDSRKSSDIIYNLKVSIDVGMILKKSDYLRRVSGKFLNVIFLKRPYLIFYG